MKIRYYLFTDKGRIKRYKKHKPEHLQGKMITETIQKLNELQNIHFFTCNFNKPYQVWIADNPAPSNKSLLIAKSFLKMKKG